MDDGYVAGFFDGEGSAMVITIRRNLGWAISYTIYPRISISQKTHMVLDQMSEYLSYGRVVCNHKRDMYKLVVEKIEDILSFVETIGPLSVIKGRQLQLLKELCLIKLSRNGGNTPYGRETLGRMLDIRNEINRLNNITRGNSPLKYTKEKILSEVATEQRIEEWSNKRHTGAVTASAEKKKQIKREQINAEEIYVPCACGCGQKIRKFDFRHRERQFISGHNARGKRWRWKKHELQQVKNIVV